MPLFGQALPDFPWDTLVPARQRAAQYGGRTVDLTIGTPVDRVPESIQRALVAASNTSGYPAALGSAQWQQAMRKFLADTNRLSDVAHVQVLPTLGSKEMVALLPSLLGLGPGSKVGFPRVSYPTYDVGARLAGATPVPLDVETPQAWPTDLDLIWLNSPGNPDGHVLSAAALHRIVLWARHNNVVVASDECYNALVWDVEEAPSALAPAVCDASAAGILVLYSFSKQSNLAGYRAAFIAGDPRLLTPIAEIRKHAGFMMPAPVEAAMIAAAQDSEHALEQRALYQHRREQLLSALASTSLINDSESVAGLYLWLEHASGADAWELVDAFAQHGIVVTPGTFYGEAGAKRVRLSLTACDADIVSACERLADVDKVLMNR